MALIASATDYFNCESGGTKNVEDCGPVSDSFLLLESANKTKRVFHELTSGGPINFTGSFWATGQFARGEACFDWEGTDTTTFRTGDEIASDDCFEIDLHRREQGGGNVAGDKYRPRIAAESDQEYRVEDRRIWLDKSTLTAYTSEIRFRSPAVILATSEGLVVLLK